MLGIFAKAEHKNFEWIEFHFCWAYLLKGGRSTLVVSNYARQVATHGSDPSVLLWFVQFVKLSFRFYSHTVIDHNFFLEVLCYYLLIESESELTVVQRWFKLTK